MHDPLDVTKYLLVILKAFGPIPPKDASPAIKGLAHGAISELIRTKQIKPARKCSVCDEWKRTYAHHDDYSQPLSIRWLCGSCHMQWHRKDEGRDWESAWRRRQQNLDEGLASMKLPESI